MNSAKWNEMKVKIYQCYTIGDIKVLSPDEYEYQSNYSPAQFCIVEKYESLYEKALVRFKENTIYALPGKNKKIRVYNGIDREPLDYTPDEMDQFSMEEVLKYYNELDNKNLDLIFYRMAGYDKEIPDRLAFIGFDVGYLFGKTYGDGFSAICDCMFLCRWHGCDEDGTEFIKEFQQLNKNGLFDSEEQAVDYLYHYLSQDWAETGDFCILEIYEHIS